MKAASGAALFVVGNACLYDRKIFGQTLRYKFGALVLFLKIAAFVANACYVKTYKAGDVCAVAGNFGCWYSHISAQALYIWLLWLL